MVERISGVLSPGLISCRVREVSDANRALLLLKHNFLLSHQPYQHQTGLRGMWCCYFILLVSHLVLCLFRAGCDPDHGQSKQIREEQTNVAEPLPEAPADVKIISVPGEVGEGYKRKRLGGAHSAAMDGRGMAHQALSERRRALPLGKRRGTYLSVIPKIPDSMQALCFHPPMFCTF